MYKQIIFVLSAILFIVSSLNARPGQDTIKIDIAKAERMFLENNLQLLAAKFNIKASEGAIIQAGLWNNPNISLEQNIYNQYTQKYFDLTSSGNTGVQIQQLFDIAGKKNKQIHLADLNKEIAELNYYELVRTLKFEIRTDFNDLYYLRKSLQFYNESIPGLNKAVQSIEGVYSKRSVLLSEMLRLKALLYTLENERLGIINQISEIQNDLRILLNGGNKGSSYFIAELNQEAADSIALSNLNLDAIINIALEKRGDYKTADANIRSEETNLKLQQAMAIPDLTIGGTWSRQGSYIPNYYAVNISIDLPIFNRNQGNIIVSQNTLDANLKLKEQIQMNVEREVTNAFNKAIETDKLYRSFDKSFIESYKKLVQGMIENYEKRYITIIEFTDFFESYRTSVLQINQLNNNRLDALENLNYKAGADIIKATY